MKNLFLLSALLPMLLLAGCSKDETATDPRDQYVGNYNYITVGSVSMNAAGTALYTVPINDNGTATVTKSGDNELNIDGITMTLSGNSLLPVTAPFNESVTEQGVSMNISGTVTLQGTVSVGIITVNATYSGIWNGSQGDTSLSGTISGTAVSTFTKQ